MATISNEQLERVASQIDEWGETYSGHVPDILIALRELQSLRSQAGVSEAVAAMTPEEHRLEDLKQMAKYSGPIVSFEVREPYYLASCDTCGWVGSSEACGTDSGGDDSDVYCPRCHASGADCGKVATSIFARPAPIEITDAMVDAAHATIEQSFRTEPWVAGPPSLLARSVLTAALQGETK